MNPSLASESNPSLRSLDSLQERIEEVFVGKPHVVELAIVTFLAGGHLLVEDVPGVGKTTLALALSKAVGCSFQRIQFTSDLLPSDILGVSILDPKTQAFEFRHGPIFHQIVLADELNRSTPRTQSALLEAMNERQVTLDNRTYPLPTPFFVIGTQNPLEHHGTFPLPESQLDRFMMRISIGYPDTAHEKKILSAGMDIDTVRHMQPALAAAETLAWMDRVPAVRVTAPIDDYILAIVQATRASKRATIGVSPRGALALRRATQALALVKQRDYVTPDDVKILAVPVLAHRLLLEDDETIDPRRVAERFIQNLVDEIPVPI